MSTDRRNLIGVTEVARRLVFSRQYIYVLAAKGELQSIKFGRAVRFDPKDVERFIRDHRRKAG